MRKFTFVFLWVGLLAGAPACSPVRVLNTQTSPGFNLGSYQTFGFMEVKADSSGVNIPSEYLASLQREVASQLKQRGLTQTTTEPDLLVNLGVVVQEKTQTRQTDIRSDPPYYMGQRRYTWKSKEVEVGRYKEGTISVHLVDRARNELVWGSEAESVIPGKEGKVQERISAGVEKLFSSIPVTGGVSGKP
ncbi:DUF4136 domain-containing protein [Rufibacter glacialis]|uniref:DUF4136 domain-containing protein n=1 Tax=Rufibacter glacialis TaxID=1259555 RepID=A0A5M8QE00_9BACT|nr:DUF4136 domain-containing protein [Rufibacter glacialis]KAA6434239.1 DUF4136 domain-containing protein [Rufibacter glacialis]GGK68022.1 lipoprotein [Rufibacter glacialis]